MTTPFDFDFTPSHHPITRPSLPVVMRPLPPIARGSLAPWQAKRVRTHIDGNLQQRLSVDVLAAVVSLSTSHFCRAFKRSFGVSVHRYVMQRRVEVAQSLMLNTGDSLSGIALTCGMSDQSHLTRWFHRVVGETPAAWRRTHRE
jgi:AraC family transcriptional regulator